MTIKTINKKVTTAFGKKIYLLGKDTDGKYVWLESPQWDCGWYWGFGYIERYTNNRNPEHARDIYSHTHWDGEIVGKQDDGTYVHHMNDNPKFAQSVLTNDESWQLAEHMRVFYLLKDSAALFEKGNAHISSNADEAAIVQRKQWAEEINQKILPELFKKIDALLTPKEA